MTLHSTPGDILRKKHGVKGYKHPMLIAALFTIARTWMQHRNPSTEERIKKMWYTYTMEHSSAIKKNETMSFALALMDIEIVILSEVSQAEKDKYCMKSLICRIF